MPVSAETPRIPIHSLHQLVPNVHWAKRIKRAAHQGFDRRIYDFELLYVQKGEMEVEMAGQTSALHAGSLLYIPSKTLHTLKIITDIVVIGIHFDYFGELAPAEGDDIVVNEAACNDSKFCAEPELPLTGPLLRSGVTVAPRQIVPFLEGIVDEFDSRRMGFELACRGMLLHLLSFLLRSQELADRKVDRKYGEQILQVARQIETEYAEDWSNLRIARELNLHEDYAAKLFKDAMGMPPGKYVQRIRHQEAKKMLRETDDTVEFVGKQVGYEDMHYFSRIFTKLEGLSPGKYRKLTQII